MNRLRQFCAGLILTLALAVSTFAGNIECGGVVDQPPPPTEAATGGTLTAPDSTDPVTELVLFILSLI